MKKFAKIGLTGFLSIVLCLTAILPIFAASGNDVIADGYSYCTTVYYDADNPYNDAHGKSSCEYKCYINGSFIGNYKPIIFVHDGKIVRDSVVNNDLLKMYFAQNFRAVFGTYLQNAKDYISISKQLKLTKIVEDIGSAASESLGSIGSIYLTGGTASLGQITSMVTDATVEQLTSHMVDVVTIISDAQITYFYMTVKELEGLVKEIEGISDYTTFKNCEKYADCIDNLMSAEYCASTLTKKISTDLEDMDSFLEVLGKFALDAASGFVGEFAEFLISSADLAAMKKADPEYFSKIISFAAAIAECEQTVGDFGEVLMSAVEFGLGDAFTVVEAYKARENAQSQIGLLINYNQIGLSHHPASEPEADDTGNNDAQDAALEEFNAKLNKFKEKKYAHGSKYKNNPSLTGGYECFGFANELALYIFGSYPTSSMSAKTVNKGWTREYGGDAVDKLCIGDIVRYGYHSIFITGIDGETIYYCQANVPAGTNKVTYGNSISRSDLKAKVSKKLTSANTDKTGWVAHYTTSNLSASNSAQYIATDFNATIKDGIYTLKIASAAGTMLNVYDGSNSCKNGTSLTTWQKDGTADQKFYFKHESGGKYRIYAVCSGKNGSVYNKVVDVNVGDNGALDLGDSFDVWDKDASWNNCQLFYIVPVGDGKYVIELVSKPNAVLSAKNATEAAKNGGKITLRDYDGKTTMQWYFYDESGTNAVDPGIDASQSNTEYYPGTYKVTESAGLNIRSDAGTSYKKLGALINNTTVNVVEVKGSWGKITYNGITGWISLDYTRFVSPIVSSVSLKTLPSKTNYYIGESLNTSGLTLTVNYSDNTSETVSEGFTCTPSSLTSVGKQTVLVDYNGKQVCFDVDVVEITYTVSYVASGSDNEPSAQTKTHGTPLVLSAEAPSKDGYTFMGWSTDNTSTTADYYPGGKYSNNADITLYAVWNELPPSHVHDFTSQTPSDLFKVSAATCLNRATYYYSCGCGERSDEIFEYGELADHSFTRYVSNGDATYTEDGTKTAKCDLCEAERTVTDEGTAKGLCAKFEDEVLKVLMEDGTENTYMAIVRALKTYGQLSEDERLVVEDHFTVLQAEIDEYNAKAEIANEEAEKATEFAFAPIAGAFSFLSLIWFALKKRFLV